MKRFTFVAACSAAIVAVALVTVGAPALGARLEAEPTHPPSAMTTMPITAFATWQPTAEQVATAARSLMAAAKAADGSIPVDEAMIVAQTVTDWPSNVTKVEVLATDRSQAVAAMGSPGATPGDTRPVLLFQVTGDFVDRVFPHPADVTPSLTPRTLITVAIDASTGSGIDGGITSTPLTWDSAAAQVVFER